MQGFLPSSQSGFTVSDSYAVVMRLSCRHGRRGIALDQHPIGLQCLDNRVHLCQDPSSYIAQTLSILHDVKVIIRLELKELKTWSSMLLAESPRSNT